MAQHFPEILDIKFHLIFENFYLVGKFKQQRGIDCKVCRDSLYVGGKEIPVIKQSAGKIGKVVRFSFVSVSLVNEQPFSFFIKKDTV